MSKLDLVLAQLLWRILVIDQVFAAHLGTGFDRAMSLGRWLLRQQDISAILTEAATKRLVDAARQAGGMIVRPPAATDWSRALGPAGQENRLLSRAQRTKVLSIGATARFR
jgi:cell division inhibitor SulA